MSEQVAETRALKGDVNHILQSTNIPCIPKKTKTVEVTNKTQPNTHTNKTPTKQRATTKK